MIPIVFCASLPPCPREYIDAETNWSQRKVASTAPGVARTKAQETASTRSRARQKPAKGDRKIAAAVFPNPVQTTALRPALAVPAPTIPPISACELEDGMPAHQVIRFQAIAPMRAPKI